jgi:glycosyltransferase involved in cell wall biosynthesis
MQRYKMDSTKENRHVPTFSIGMPVRNGAKYIREALDSLLAQNYADFELIISDNASTDSTEEICRGYAQKDPRIRYFRQARNIGGSNFRFVLQRARGVYFMWAAHDDEWDERFVETGVKTLVEDPGYDAWFCTVKSVDGFGRVIREYAGFSRFTSTGNKWKDIIKYLLEPEIMGKANLVYSIYRRDALNKTVKEYFFKSVWGSDMCFNLAFLTRFNLVATDEVLFHKRLVRPSDNEKQADPIVIEKPYRHIFPLKESLRYIRENYRAAHVTPYGPLVLLVMLSRLPIAVRNAIAGRNDLFSTGTLKNLVQKIFGIFGYRIEKIKNLK